MAWWVPMADPPVAVVRTDPDRPIVLVGMMASGKTTVGQKLARRLGLAFADSDVEIERRAGHTVAELFAAEGEPAFRILERAVLADLVGDGTVGVIATGGGAVIDPATRKLLREQASVVWLRATPGVSAHRASQQDTDRPLLGRDARATMDRLWAEREPWYREVADNVIDVDMVDRRTVLRRVLAALTESGAVRALDAPVTHPDERLVP